VKEGVIRDRSANDDANVVLHIYLRAVLPSTSGHAASLSFVSTPQLERIVVVGRGTIWQ